MGPAPLPDGWERAFDGRRVLLTGHTGFKGGWLALWLTMLGARVTGVALPPPPGPSLFEALGLASEVDHRIADIRDRGAFASAVSDADPQILVHLAAQPLVRASYDDPVGTIETNVAGTAIVLEAARRMPSLEAILVVTSDKCYENGEWVWGYRESDPVGGSDPYSASKGCTELVATAFRRSFFAGPGAPHLATARAGNVFGGGDWSADRLVPDMVRAFAGRQPVRLRNPSSTRPWQHVLDCLEGYLRLIAQLVLRGEAYARAWNFGPDRSGIVTVGALAERFASAWGEGARVAYDGTPGPAEARTLQLDSGLARAELGWQPRLDLDTAVPMTVEWHKFHLQTDACMKSYTLEQIRNFTGLRPVREAA